MIYVGDDACPARITERVGDSISHCSTTVCKALRHQLGLTPRELHFSPQPDIPIVIASSTMSSSTTPDQVGNSRLHDNARISHDRTGPERLRPHVLRSKGQTATAGANSCPSAPQGSYPLAAILTSSRLHRRENTRRLQSPLIARARRSRDPANMPRESSRRHQSCPRLGRTRTRFAWQSSTIPGDADGYKGPGLDDDDSFSSSIPLVSLPPVEEPPSQGQVWMTFQHTELPESY
jgi:hypothetical protein